MRFCLLVMGILLSGPAVLASDIPKSEELRSRWPGLNDTGDTHKTPADPRKDFSLAPSKIVPSALDVGIRDQEPENGNSLPASSVPLMLESRVPEGFQWKKATADSFRFLMLQNAARIAFQVKTRRGLSGSFFADYSRTLRTAPSGFMDGDTFLTNFIGHPIQGATTYHIARLNGASRRQALWWGVAYSTHFEAGLLGEAGIGNAVVSPVDLVVTPVAGYYLGVVEERLFARINRIERPKIRMLSRLLLAGRLLARISSGK